MKQRNIGSMSKEIEANIGENSKTLHQKIKEVPSKKRQKKQGAHDQKMETF